MLGSMRFDQSRQLKIRDAPVGFHDTNTIECIHYFSHVGIVYMPAGSNSASEHFRETVQLTVINSSVSPPLPRIPSPS